MKLCKPIGMIVASYLFCSAAYSQDAEKQPDNGTDPSRFSTAASIQYEHIGLRQGFNLDTLNFTYLQPIGEKANYNLRVRLPVVRNDVLGNEGYNVGDFSLKLNHVYKLTRQYAIILAAEMSFDTADRAELGTGKNVFKPTFIYAKFLENGAIFAPAVVQSNSLWGDSSRADVNNTVFDFYYVPKMSDPKTFVTIDPALSLDWESHKQFASLAVTLGRSIGPAFGGNSQVFIKPTIFAGGERPGNWGIEVGYKVIGF